MTLKEQFHKAWLVSTPLIAVRTLDPAATIANLTQVTNGSPVLVWDCIRGVSGYNDTGRAVVDVFKEVDPAALANPIELMLRAPALPPKTLIYFINGHELLNNPASVQAIWNLRDLFKQDRRTVVILCPSLNLPATLSQDVVVMDEPLPDTAALAAIVLRTYQDAEVSKPSDALVMRAVDAICGLGHFAAEQVCAMSMSPEGMDVHSLWERKRQQIENTGGLTVYRGKEKASDVKGADNIIDYLSSTMSGDPQPSVVVFMDEIEKMFSGMGNDQDSTTKEMVGKFLTWTENKLPNGKPSIFAVLLLGPAGTGKSMLAKAIGNEFERPTIIADFSSMKDSLVGQSQQNVDQAFKIIDAVAGDKPKLLIATCNSVAVLPPEVRSRFGFGTFFVDLPDADARAQQWKQYIKEFGLPDKATPDDSGWTGREIRNCCMIAAQQKKPLKQVAPFIIPVSKSASEQIAQLRRDASGRYVSAAKPGAYIAPSDKNSTFPTTTTGRAISTKK